MNNVNFPDWAAFTPEKVQAELPQQLEAAERAIAAIEAAQPTDYEALVWKMDDATKDLWRTWGRVSHMLGVMNSEAWRAVEEAWQARIVAFSLRVAQSEPILRAAKAIRAEDPVRRRILEKLVQSAELAGIGLSGEARTRFNEIQARLATLENDFRNAVIDSTAAFRYEKGGVTYTIDDAAYVETMRHCPDAEVRERLCRARAMRAPENAVRIEEILALRREAASLLGYATYAKKSLATKCAPSVAVVMRMIDALDEATRAIAVREDAELPQPVLPWNLAYDAERLRERTFSYSEEELKRHFELGDVLSGLWRMANLLFGVEIRAVEGAAKPSVWHEDVRVFEVCEKGAAIAHFYVDPFVRSGLKQGGAWMNEFRNRSARTGEMPLAVLVMNFPKPDAEGRCLLPMREVETLFHEFGHALQCMLTRVDEEDAAGINLVEWDAVEVASQFMENWCLDDRTGIAVPPELKAKVRAAKNFRAASACRRQLAFATTDLILHGDPAIWAGKAPNDVKNETFARFGLRTVEGDGFLNAFGHIFAGGYAAGYYGYKWAEVMSADCFGAFEEAGLEDDAALARIGARYRETILALGGGESALDVFRKFRGREPEIDALLRQQGLVEAARS